MIRFFCFIALLFFAGTWLWQKTALPGVEPLSSEEISNALSESAPSDRSLTVAFEQAVKILEEDRREDSPPRSAPPASATETSISTPRPRAPEGERLLQRVELPRGVIDSLPPRLIEAFEAPQQNADAIAQLIHEEMRESARTQSSAIDSQGQRSRLLDAALGLSSALSPSSREALAADLAGAALRQLEMPTPARGASPEEVEALRKAGTLLSRVYGKNREKLAAIHSQIGGLHPSEEAQAALKETLLAGGE